MDLESVRCSCCGGIDITVSKNKKLGTCNHCGATVIMPRENEEVVSLLNTAYLQRANYDFDAAIKTYEFALDKDSNEKSAYEGLLLAKYGIEYVKDPRTGRLVPTCHRTHFNSIYEDDAYLVLNELCDDEEKEALAKKVAEIDKLQKAIVKQLEKEEDFDIFISYKATDEKGEKTEDSIIARNIYDKLTAQNYKVFFSEKTLEDRLGSDYEPIIFKAINTAKMFILVGTKKDYINSVWVKNEWTRFIDRIKTDNELSAQSFIPVFKEMSPYDMPKVNNKFVQGVDASKLGYDITVADGISKMLKPKEEKDVIKTFNSFENIVEFKKVQKQAKKEHHKKKYEELKNNKKKFIPYLILQILCFAIPAVMVGLTFSIEFFSLRYAPIWAFIILSVIWAILFVLTIIIRHKLGVGQSAKSIFGSCVIVAIGITLTILMFSGVMYELLYGINPNNMGLNSYSKGCYYTHNSWDKDNSVSSMYIVRPNAPNNSLVMPETLDGRKVELTYCNIYNSFNEVTINAGSEIGFYAKSGASIERLKITGILEKFNIYGVNNSFIKKLVIDSESTSIRIGEFGSYIPAGGNEKETIFEELVIEGNYNSLDITTIHKYGSNTILDKIGKLTVNGKVDKIWHTSDIKIIEVNNNEINKLEYGPSYYTGKVEEIKFSNSISELIIDGSYYAKSISIDTLKIGRSISKIMLKTYNHTTTLNVDKILYEGTAEEWAAIQKELDGNICPGLFDGATILYEQNIA